MSSYGTHMLIGAVGGLALTRLVNVHSPDMAPIVVIGSALLATWPDIDEPNSFIARRARAVVTLIGTGLGGVIGYAQAARFAQLPIAGAAVGVLAGVLISTLLAILLLKGIRYAAGGHRRLTHSLVIGGLLAALAAALSVSGFATGAFVLGALAWGQVLHLLGDIVTPAGVPVFYPFSGRDLRVLPSGLARFGEAIAGVGAVLLAYILIRF